METPPTMSRPAVIVLSSFVARGSVGARAAFALERLGHRVWTLPTVILPWHPGHGRAHRMALPEADFAALCADLARAPWLSEVGGIITGYLGSPGQADAAAGVTARATGTPLAATLDPATAARAVLVDAARAWVVPLDADDTTVEVRYRW